MGERPGGLAGDALLRPVRGNNAFEDTVYRLLQTIRLGIVPPGGSLPSERELALRLGVGRDTVREAIRALSDAGYLTARRGRYGGTFVVDELPARTVTLRRGDTVATTLLPRPEDLEDVLRLREILELGAVRQAANRALTARERETLHRHLQEVGAAGEADYRRLDARLHLTICELVGSPSLIPLFADNRTRVDAFLDEIPLLPPNIEHSNEQHAAVVAAILTGDPDRAVAAMAEHLSGTAALLVGFLGDATPGSGEGRFVDRTGSATAGLPQPARIRRRTPDEA
ncbi:MAG: FadR/GntR family transcriptional regulator [Pseudonocardia sp.]